MASHILWFALQLMLFTAAELVWLCKFLRLCRHLCNIHQNSVITSRKKYTCLPLHWSHCLVTCVPFRMSGWDSPDHQSWDGKKLAGWLLVGSGKSCVDMEAVWHSRYFSTLAVNRKAFWTERRRCLHSQPCTQFLLIYVRVVDIIKVTEKILKSSSCARIKISGETQPWDLLYAQIWRPSSIYWKYDQLCIKFELSFQGV